MGRLIVALVVMSLATLAGGCKNRCNNGGCLGFLSGSPVIAPPGTGTLNIPGVASQNYYQPQPGQVAQNPQSQPSGWTNAGGQTTPANSSQFPSTAVSTGPPSQAYGQLPGLQQQWRNTSSGIPATPPPGSINNSNTMFPNDTRPMLQTGTRMISPDFVSTRVNEQNDPTRMAVADASGVRMPSPFGQMPNAGWMVGSSMPVMSNPGYSIPNSLRGSTPLQNQLVSGQLQNSLATQGNWVISRDSNESRTAEANQYGGWYSAGSGQAVSR